MTELIWDGKYDKTTGKKIAPPRIALPFQTVETVNESTADRDRNLSLFGGGPSSEWRNRLIWGDKKYVLPSLLPEFAGKVNLIYIDPPFDTGANFSFMATVPDDPNTPGDQSTTFTKEPSVIEQKAYRDTWGKGLDSYLKWFYETVVVLRELLARDGFILVHLNSFMAPYCRLIMEEVFGSDNYRNSIVVRRGMKNLQSQFDTIQALAGGYDVVTLYSANPSAKMPKLDIPFDEARAGSWNNHWRGTNRPTMRYPLLGLPAPSSGQYRWSRERSNKAVKNYEAYLADGDGRTIDQYYLQQLEATDISLDFVRLSSTGKPEHYIPPADAQLASDVLTGLRTVGKSTGYPTEKHEELLEQMIGWLSSEDDLVLDCFCGSGTTAAVAEKLGRRWITCDLGRFAIHTARKRFLAIEGVKPFIVQNLGKYERQAWQKAEFGADADALTQSYREFILNLYGARPLTGYVWLHGVKGGRMVHVGGVDAPVSQQDVAQIAAEFSRSRGTGENAPTQNTVDILGWDFAFELNEVAKQQAAQAGVTTHFIRIPREVLEKKAVEQGDIKFFELAALAVKVTPTGKGIMLTLEDFVIPLDDVPQEIQSAITNWEQWIDYWAVDWDNKGDTFHNQWQSYRTRKSKTLQKQIASPPGTYKEPGEYKVVVKVIDILGNDTTKTLTVTLA